MTSELILQYYENKEDNKLIDLYKSDNNKFIINITNLCLTQKKSQIPLLKHLHAIGIDVNSDKGKKLIWRCVQKCKLKYVQHLLYGLDYDSEQAVFCNRIIFQVCMESEQNYNKYKSILELLLDKISEKSFHEITQYPLNNNHKKNTYSSIYQFFLSKRLPQKTNKTANIKIAKI